MKVALTAIVKNENKYLREWVEYYKQLGVDHIYIGDNNDSEGEQLETVLYDYLELPNPYITIVNVKNKKIYQRPLYEFVYNEYGYKYDWMCFFDLDEFLYLKEDRTIQDYLSRDIFNDAEQIHINWLIYDDNDLIKYDNRPVQERFTRISEKVLLNNKLDYYINNNTIKSIIRTQLNVSILNSATWKGNDNELKTVNEYGGYNNEAWTLSIPNYSLALLKHYPFKSLEEFLIKRYMKHSAELETDQRNLSDFFRINKETKEKENFITKYFDEKTQS